MPTWGENDFSLQQVGETTIYLAELQTFVQALNLKYGVITRSDPLKLVVHTAHLTLLMQFYLSYLPSVLMVVLVLH